MTGFIEEFRGKSAFHVTLKAGMVVLTSQEGEYLRRTTACRIATVGKDGMPHVVPVRFCWDGQYIYLTTDFGAKKHRNLKENPKAAIVVDDFASRSGVLIQGEAEVIEGGEEFVQAQQVLIERGVMKRLRQEGEEAVVRVRPVKVASWGVNPP